MIPVFPARRLLRLLLLLAVVPGSGAAQSGTREAMADAMARMMEAMGLFDTAPAEPWSARRPTGTWGSALGTPRLGTPRSGPLNRSRTSPLRDLMRQFAREVVPPGGGGWRPSRLEGVWEGRTEELLIVQGGRYRIYSPRMQRVDGLLRIRGDRLALYNPLDRRAQPFEFAEHQGRLILRDLAGNLYLYRRLRLNSK